MEDIAPPLKCLIELQFSIRNGDSIRVGLSRFLKTSHDEFAIAVRKWLFAWDQGQDWRAVVRAIKSPYRRTLLEVAASGLSGHSVLAMLDELEEEIRLAAELELKAHIEMLPLRMMIPLLLLMFPAFLILLFGPLLNQFVTEMSR